MDIKVGDMVKYQDRTVRVLQLDTEAPNYDNREIKLAGFGWFGKNNPDIELVESVKLPQFNDGDYVVVRDIPRIEKDYYGTSWMPSMDKYVDKTVQVFNPRKSDYSGEVVTIDGWSFQTYHLDPVHDYDIV